VAETTATEEAVADAGFHGGGGGGRRGSRDNGGNSSGGATAATAVAAATEAVVATTGAGATEAAAVTMATEEAVIVSPRAVTHCLNSSTLLGSKEKKHKMTRTSILQSQKWRAFTKSHLSSNYRRRGTKKLSSLRFTS